MSIVRILLRFAAKSFCPAIVVGDRKGGSEKLPLAHTTSQPQTSTHLAHQEGSQIGLASLDCTENRSGTAEGLRIHVRAVLNQALDDSFVVVESSCKQRGSAQITRSLDISSLGTQ